MTWFSLCSAMIINNTNIFIISTWAFMFICMWVWKREKNHAWFSHHLSGVLQYGWKYTTCCLVQFMKYAPFATNTDMLSTILYLELCKLFSHGTRNGVTLFCLRVLLWTQNLQPVSKMICPTKLFSETSVNVSANVYPSCGNEFTVLFHCPVRLSNFADVTSQTQLFWLGSALTCRFILPWCLKMKI